MRHPRGAPRSVAEAMEYVAATCLSPGPPGTIGVELEWLVNDPRDRAATVPAARVADALPAADQLAGRLTTEPGGQLELSSAPARSLAAAMAGVDADMELIRRHLAAAGLRLTGAGADPDRQPTRLVDTPRYAAMEEFFDRSGPHGRIMMCGTASVQVCLDAGLLGDDPAGAGPWPARVRRGGGGNTGMTHRWRVAHAIGPVLIGAFANSPRYAGRPTGWKSTRQAVWARLDPSRTLPARGADPALAWAGYAMDALVLCVRPADPAAGGTAAARWSVPHGMTFRDWLSGAGERRPSYDDLDYHLTTLFPPVRPRRWLELRMIDAQPGDDGWAVPLAVATALVEDAAAAGDALAATERWDPFDPVVSLRAARVGLADPELRQAAVACFAAALGGLGRLGAARAVTAAVERFADSYVTRGRCPADDWPATGDPAGEPVPGRHGYNWMEATT